MRGIIPCIVDVCMCLEIKRSPIPYLLYDFEHSVDMLVIKRRFERELCELEFKARPEGTRRILVHRGRLLTVVEASVVFKVFDCWVQRAPWMVNRENVINTDIGSCSQWRQLARAIRVQNTTTRYERLMFNNPCRTPRSATPLAMSTSWSGGSRLRCPESPDVVAPGGGDVDSSIEAKDM